MEDWCKEAKEKLDAHSESDQGGVSYGKGGPFLKDTNMAEYVPLYLDQAAHQPVLSPYQSTSGLKLHHKCKPHTEITKEIENCYQMLIRVKMAIFPSSQYK